VFTQGTDLIPAVGYSNGMTTECTARVILDSKSPQGVRLTTIEVTFWRPVLAEFNTHRVFSRNSASSRAIPVEKQLARVKDDPSNPISWPCEQPGMQGGVELEGEDLEDAQRLWNDVRMTTLALLEGYLEDHPEKEHRLHKSVLNRVLEPFMWHTVIVSATSFDNFFDLRCNPMAQPEIHLAADQMRDAYNRSRPTELRLGQWHLPYIHAEDYRNADLSVLKQVSAARCARVSYLTHDGRRDYEADLQLFARLTTASPAHASPLEHVATPCECAMTYGKQHFGNFDGFDQLRHML
jgi:hypothetical protein